MKIAYLVNQYPQVSHSFIRREILGLEAIGHVVSRFTLRASEGTLPDPGDRAEREQTRAVLGVGVFGLLHAAAWQCFANFRRFASVLTVSLREGRRSDRGLARHAVGFAEACVLARWLADGKVDHLHAHFGTNSAAVAMMAGLLTAIPYSFTVHGPEEFDRAPGLGLSEKARHASFVVAISDFGRGQLMRWTRAVDWPKLRVVRCGLDAAFLADPQTTPPDNTRVVCVGRLVEQKAQLVLVESAAILKRRGVPIEVRLVGDGPMRAEVEAAITAHDLQDSVTILGWRSALEVREEMRGARLVAQPSLAEGLPVAVMEALALGRPVVTTQIAGIPELVDAGCGWIVPPGCAETLADALASGLSAPVDALREMGREGRDRVLSRHNIAAEVSKLNQLLVRH